MTESKHSVLEYARAEGRRRWRTLNPAVAVAMVACGALWGLVPCIAMAWMLEATQGRGAGIPDYCLALLWLTAAAGLMVVVLGAALCAPQRSSAGAS